MLEDREPGDREPWGSGGLEHGAEWAEQVEEWVAVGELSAGAESRSGKVVSFLVVVFGLERLVGRLWRREGEPVGDGCKKGDPDSMFEYMKLETITIANREGVRSRYIVNEWCSCYAYEDNSIQGIAISSLSNKRNDRS